MGITRGTIKSILTGCAFLGLVAWIAVIQVNQQSHEQKFSHHERKIRSIDENTSSRIKRAVSNKKTGGATYIRWGRTECPGDAELVYKGYAAGQWYQHTGGSAEYICLTDEPVFTQNSAGENSGSWIYGVEIENGPPKWPLLEATNSKPSDLVNSNVKCAVCRTPTRSSKLMIPGTNKCSPGWTMEYWGYLMTGHHQHAAQHNYACLDKAPEAGSEGGSKDENGALMYHVQGDCGYSLPCQPYVHGYELTCVVCTK